MDFIVNVIAQKDGKILMVKENQGSDAGKWNFPAGHLDEFENIFDGAIREAKEETGYDVKLTGLVDVQNLLRPQKHIVLIMFAAEIVSGGGVWFY